MVLNHLKEGAAIINATLANAYKGNEVLLDYTSTKGAVEAFTRVQSLQLVKKGIRMNLVSPGPRLDVVRHRGQAAGNPPLWP